MRWVVAVLVSPFWIVAGVAHVLWVAIQAGWLAGDIFMENNFGDGP